MTGELKFIVVYFYVKISYFKYKFDMRVYELVCDWWYTLCVEFEMYDVNMYEVEWNINLRIG